MRCVLGTGSGAARICRRHCLALALVGLSACQGHDWRAEQTERAEDRIRTEVGDSSAVFSGVQVTGDDQTGQVCGRVKPGGAFQARFIVYIDGTAGPYLAAGEGQHPIPNDLFESVWRGDCLGEGYKPE